ncbi:Nop53 (60S ribosomal biogenesis) [Micractinium conductrix]|uniref:Ribosome biogenesis protein NOP53 n=1 Tax=Micractinium conductrix TaxID=554055 RepID=A0A2P6VRB5_9CHLO|nr:Nop53 (60S ribosomal biogenesis) [Micractinium conductrix]|eukprot:PSC76643.1 Nop53 (60S ribosomal biogenesis) [Micractinium conductrix]
MVKKRGSKRSWAKIDHQDVEDFLEKSTREERQGLAVEGVPDAELFFEDKAPDEGTAVAVKEGRLPRKLAARQKVLRSAAILAAAHGATPVARPPPRKPKGSGQSQPAAPQQPAQQQQRAAGGRVQRQGRTVDPAELAIWEPEVEQQGGGWVPQAKRAPKRHKRGGAAPAALVPAAAAAAGIRPHIPAVEIDPAGCSYNPDVELHQEAVAVAVAAETRKLLDKELQPVAPPRTVDYDVETDELALLQTLEGGGDEDDEEEGQQQEGAEDAGGVEAARRKQEAAKKTRRDRNREARRRGAEDLLKEQRRLKAQRHELSSLKQIQGELAEEEADKDAARLRRQLDKAERMAAEPPKLSKHRFQPMPLQVLTSDELQGSLRRLKPTTMLAKDRFKSLQKRALIEPRRKIEQKKQGKKVEYIQGERAERAQERHAELQDIKTSRKKAKKVSVAKH